MAIRRGVPTAALVVLFGLLMLPAVATLVRPPQGLPANETRPRGIVSTDIGGTDPDDFQSMVHFLLYADMSRAFFATQLGGSLKMGDSPSVGYVFQGTPSDPSRPGWGGQFVRVWDGRKTVFTRNTTAADTAEAFGVVEFRRQLPEGMRADQRQRAPENLSSTFDEKTTTRSGPSPPRATAAVSDLRHKSPPRH